MASACTGVAAHIFMYFASQYTCWFSVTHDKLIAWNFNLLASYYLSVAALDNNAKEFGNSNKSFFNSIYFSHSISDFDIAFIKDFLFSLRRYVSRTHFLLNLHFPLIELSLKYPLLA
jgi:hypothetical protein